MQAEIISGHCLCGQICYEYVGLAGPASYCHCEDCRRSTGSAFNIVVRMDSNKFRIIAGSPKGFTKIGDSGKELTRHFCPECGSPVYGSSIHYPDVVFVKAGTLDDPDLVKPSHQSWAASAVCWSRLESDIKTYERGRS